MNSLRLLMNKIAYNGVAKVEAMLGRPFGLRRTLAAMAARPFELHLELTNVCSANCVFCPYQYQRRAPAFMSDAIFEKALGDYVADGGGSLFLSPLVGDPLVAPNCLERIRQARARPAIDRIRMITNGILVDRCGADALITSGVTHLIFSIAGFDEAMYERVYRSKHYRRVYKNIIEVLEANRRHGDPVSITIGLRPDRPLAEVVASPDFKAVSQYQPYFDFNWAYTTIGGKITSDQLPEAMKTRVSPRKTEACVSLYHGPVVLADGTVLGCSCVAAMDAIGTLGIGDITRESLGAIWRSEAMARLRASFQRGPLNDTCRSCDAYRNLDFYCTREGRARARINQIRGAGGVVRRGLGNRGGMVTGG